MRSAVTILLAVALVTVSGCGVKRQTVTVVPSKTRPIRLEFYYMRDIQSPNNPLGQWRMEMAPGHMRSYVFTDANGKSIDSLSDPQKLKDLVVQPKRNLPILTGRDLVPNAEAILSTSDQPVVNIQFNTRGTEIFRRFTRAHVGDYLAIFCDGKLLTVPSIMEAIPSGRAQISGFKSLVEAQRTADGLNAVAPGPRPASVPVRPPVRPPAMGGP